jgi:MFS family permease
MLRTFSSSVYVPAVPEIMSEFHISSTVALLGLSVYVLGHALGPALAAPLSETFGRAVVYKSTFPVAMLFNLGAGLAQSFPAFCVCRFLAATTGSPALAVGAGLITPGISHGSAR